MSDYCYLREELTLWRLLQGDSRDVKFNEGLKSDLKTSQTVAAELRCQVVEADRKLQEEKRQRSWEREMAALVEEKEELADELKHQRELDSVSQKDLDVMCSYPKHLGDPWLFVALSKNPKLLNES
ncbi:hypothetical protein HanRHA438_Chr03g0101391 [Helianthus annuus]|nr:hypothetical protein HanRHA438_Chr03g0101391 [Helianthus annuus]